MVEKIEPLKYHESSSVDFLPRMNPIRFLYLNFIRFFRTNFIHSVILLHRRHRCRSRNRYRIQQLCLSPPRDAISIAYLIT
jgi:hypothetical protein